MTKNMNFMKEDLNFLQELLLEPTPTSYEIGGTKIWDDYMDNLGLYHYYQDKIGNSGWSLGTGDTKVLISAHLDEIGMAVLDISEEGYITMASLGGIDPKVLPGAQIIFPETNIKGIFCKAPIHSESIDFKLYDVLKLKDLRVSVGLDSKEEIEKSGIEIGSLAVLSRNINLEFGNNKLHGNGLDDKVGVYIISQIAKNIRDLNNKYTLIFLSGVQEEAGLRGLKIAARNINPDISIDLDVTPALDGECGVDKSVWGDINLGKGCVIEYGPDKSRRIADIMKKHAILNKIPYQLGVSKAGGTNTSAIQLFSSDCETMLVSIPNINMHTQNEICDWRDINSAITIISGILNEHCL